MSIIDDLGGAAKGSLDGILSTIKNPFGHKDPVRFPEDFVAGFVCQEFIDGVPGEQFALATLVGSRGSSYRRPGARMLIAADGRIAGSLSGGCLEEEVVERAREVLRTGVPALMEFEQRLSTRSPGRDEITPLLDSLPP